MKSSTIILSTLLLGWMSLSTYWYVCQIKNKCFDKEMKIETVSSEIEKEADQITKSLTKIPGNDINSDSAKIINKLKNKLKKGHAVDKFPYNSFEYSTKDNEYSEFYTQLKQLSDSEIDLKYSLTGHTDNKGSKQINKTLGLKRAEFVKKEMLKVGISSKKIITKSEGEKSPVASNSDENGRSTNRRVIIKLIEN